MPRPRVPDHLRKIPQGISLAPADLEFLKTVFPTLTVSDAVHAAILDSRSIRFPAHPEHDHA